MSHVFAFGNDEVACSGGVVGGLPAIILGTKENNPPGTTGQEFVTHPDTVIVTMNSIEAVVSVMQLLFDAAAELGRQNGIENPEDILMPVVSTKRYRHREQELLEANNRYLQRARDAEATIESLRHELDFAYGGRD